MNVNNISNQPLFSINDLPTEITAAIFACLSGGNHLHALAQVSRSWYQAAFYTVKAATAVKIERLFQLLIEFPTVNIDEFKVKEYVSIIIRSKSLGRLNKVHSIFCGLWFNQLAQQQLPYKDVISIYKGAQQESFGPTIAKEMGLYHLRSLITHLDADSALVNGGQKLLSIIKEMQLFNDTIYWFSSCEVDSFKWDKYQFLFINWVREGNIQEAKRLTDAITVPTEVIKYLADTVIKLFAAQTDIDTIKEAVRVVTPKEYITSVLCKVCDTKLTGRPSESRLIQCSEFAKMIPLEPIRNEWLKKISERLAERSDRIDSARDVAQHITSGPLRNAVTAHIDACDPRACSLM